ncbi:hypothetical protein BDV98DRAFT_586727 [Pterulicium gracile]|uniref:Uncharacterized protein n=1 Tax=Pterulicium gracile TaxID=1884261 RepID=A0A5C3Q3Z7_9AGAR|nr:hypothetical protein BDV98DRAFT_586727 [Pterula gracilis]
MINPKPRATDNAVHGITWRRWGGMWVHGGGQGAHEGEGPTRSLILPFGTPPPYDIRPTPHLNPPPICDSSILAPMPSPIRLSSPYANWYSSSPSSLEAEEKDKKEKKEDTESLFSNRTLSRQFSLESQLGPGISPPCPARWIPSGGKLKLMMWISNHTLIGVQMER